MAAKIICPSKVRILHACLWNTLYLQAYIHINHWCPPAITQLIQPLYQFHYHIISPLNYKQICILYKQDCQQRPVKSSFKPSWKSLGCITAITQDTKCKKKGGTCGYKRVWKMPRQWLVECWPSQFLSTSFHAIDYIDVFPHPWILISFREIPASLIGEQIIKFFFHGIS